MTVALYTHLDMLDHRVRAIATRNDPSGWRR